jgi:hypothetical protein
VNIYHELDIIDEFEEKVGNRESVKCACDFMVSYLAEMKRPLPEVAAQGLRVAIKYKEGSASPDKLEIAREQIADFLKERGAQASYSTLEYRMAHAVLGILISYQDLRWGGGASELVSNFLDMTETFESNHDLLKTLLKEYFSL